MFLSNLEFQTLADTLRPYAEQAMKIEVAPWIRDYAIDMDHLYADLTLEEVVHGGKGATNRPLPNYEAIFTSQRLQRPANDNKILLKADPGYGKTSIAKKINWDWAKGIFTTFILIFIVPLKGDKTRGCHRKSNH